MDEPTLGIPEHPDEPKPWRVAIDRYRVRSFEVFATREAAIEYAAIMEEGDHYLVGVFAPGSDEIDQVATKEAIPWR